MRIKVLTSTAIATLIIFIFLSAPANAQRARQAGEVLDEEGKPIVGAMVKFDRMEAGSKFDHQEIKTDENGKFVFFGIRGGDWTLVVTADGFMPYTERISVSSFTKNPDLTITLKKAAPADMGGTRSEAQELITQASDLIDLGKYDEAITLYQDFISNNPELHQVRLLLGQVYEEKGDYDNALAEYEKVLEANPENTSAIFLVGRAHINLLNYEKAEEYFLRLAELKPDDPDTMYTLGELMLDRGQGQKAIDYYSKAVTLRPTFADAHMKLGYAYYGEQQWENAIKHFEKFIELAPERPEVQFVQSDLEVCKQKLAEQN